MVESSSYNSLPSIPPHEKSPVPRKQGSFRSAVYAVLCVSAALLPNHDGTTLSDAHEHAKNSPQNGVELSEDFFVCREPGRIYLSLPGIEYELIEWKVGTRTFTLASNVNFRTVDEQIELLSLDKSNQTLVITFTNQQGTITIPTSALLKFLQEHEPTSTTSNLEGVPYCITLSPNCELLYDSCSTVTDSVSGYLPNFCKPDPLPPLRGTCTLTVYRKPPQKLVLVLESQESVLAEKSE